MRGAESTLFACVRLALCEVVMHRNATTFSQVYNENFLHAGFDLSKSVDASVGYGLHVSKGKAFAEEPNFGLILGQHLLVALAVALLPANLPAETAEVVVPALHAAADERSLHTIELSENAENELCDGIWGAVRKKCLQAILVDIHTHLQRRQVLYNRQEVYRPP